MTSTSIASAIPNGSQIGSQNDPNRNPPYPIPFFMAQVIHERDPRAGR